LDAIGSFLGGTASKALDLLEKAKQLFHKTSTNSIQIVPQGSPEFTTFKQRLSRENGLYANVADMKSDMGNMIKDGSTPAGLRELLSVLIGRSALALDKMVFGITYSNANGNWEYHRAAFASEGERMRLITVSSSCSFSAAPRMIIHSYSKQSFFKTSSKQEIQYVPTPASEDLITATLKVTAAVSAWADLLAKMNGTMYAI